MTAAARIIEPEPRFVLTRDFAAPRSVLWHAWTEPTCFARWFVPRGYRIPRIELDVRPGGAFRCDVRAPDGTIFTHLGAYTEVVEPDRLAATSRYERRGSIAFEIWMAITLAERAGGTHLTLEVRVLRAPAALEPHLVRTDLAWREALDKLGEITTVSAQG